MANAVTVYMQVMVITLKLIIIIYHYFVMIIAKQLTAFIFLNAINAIVYTLDKLITFIKD